MPFSPLILLQRVKISLLSRGKAGNGLLQCSLKGIYLHSPTICHGLVSEGLAQWRRPTEVCLFHYIDDVLLTSDSLTELEKAVPQVLSHLKSHGWAVTKAKLQGPELSVTFLGVVWLGKPKVISEAVTDKMQVYPTPATVKQLQTFWGLLWYWTVFVSRLAQVVRPLYALVKKKVSWDWTLTLGKAFQGVKHIIRHV